MIWTEGRTDISGTGNPRYREFVIAESDPSNYTVQTWIDKGGTPAKAQLKYMGHHIAEFDGPDGGEVAKGAAQLHANLMRCFAESLALLGGMAHVALTRC